tara:strand:+ start:3600 stop:4787 length:1188 start_codon:yes stop_codon:yes gene_type:complete
MNVIIFEDSNTYNLEPFSINHASFELKCGLYSNLDRIINIFNNNDVNFYLIVRNELKELIQERFPRYTVNPINIPEGLYLNGAVVWDDKLINKVMKDISFSSLGNLISFKNNQVNSDGIYNMIEKKSKVTTEINSTYISYLWDCIDLFKSMINFDKIDFLKLECINSFRNNINIVNKDNIFVDKSAIIEIGCILDASKGPIILEKNVIIESGSILKGPIFIDENSIVSNGSKLKGNNLIGPHCKVGGELTNTIFHGYSNKVHDGFLGDSYIGEWVNLGANTNNSNLKNNYSYIKFNFSNRVINTKKIFLGVMIGDFTRIGISTMINTGSYFGLGCNVFGGGFQEKYIESFSWGKDSMVKFDKLINTIKIMKDRRSQKLFVSEINFLENFYQKIKK